MIKVDDYIELKFYQVLKQKISIRDFESWIYNTQELEKKLSDDLYLDLISMDYKSKYALNDLNGLIEKYVDFGKFEIKKIKEFLKSIIDRDAKCAQSIEMTYELYCNGYNFLRRLGLRYGLLVASPPAGNYQKTWSEISVKDQNELLDKFYPDIIVDAKNALIWFDNDKIIIKNTVDELGHYEYDDFRTQEEKLQGDIETINLDRENKAKKSEMETTGFFTKLINRFK